MKYVRTTTTKLLAYAIIASLIQGPAAYADPKAAPGKPAPASKSGKPKSEVLEVGQTPDAGSLPMTPEWSLPMKRKHKTAGIMELCRFQAVPQVISPEVGMPTSSGVESECFPILSATPPSEQAEKECTWVGQEIYGTPSQLCQPKKQIVNPDAEFEACKYVHMIDDVSEASEHIRQQAQLVAVCEMIDNQPAGGFGNFNLTQLINKIGYGKATVGSLTSWIPGVDAPSPNIPDTSKKEGMTTLLDIALKAADNTKKLLEQATGVYAEAHRCFNARSELFTKNFKEIGKRVNNNNDDYKGITAAIRAIAPDEFSERCHQVTDTVMETYHKQLPELRKQMLIAQKGDGPTVEFLSPGGNDKHLVNSKFNHPSNVLLPSNPTIRKTTDLNFSPVKPEEEQEAIKTVQAWALEIEKKWDKEEGAKAVAAGVRPIADRKPGTRNKYALTGRDKMQDKWEAFYQKEMKDKREAARKEIEQMTLRNPLFQAIANDKPGHNAFGEAYKDVIGRTLTAHTKLFDKHAKGEELQIKYRADVAAWEAGGRKGSRPKDPPLDAVRDVVAAKGMLAAMVEKDPNLCAAVSMYWDTVSKYQTTDAVVEMGAIIGASVLAGMVTGGLGGGGVAGAAYGAGTGFIAGGALSVHTWIKDEQAQIGAGLITVCTEDAGRCRTPGDLEKYFGDKFGADLTIATAFIPFGKQDLVATKAVMAGLLTAITVKGGKEAYKYGKEAAKRLFGNGKVDYATALKAFQSGDFTLFKKAGVELGEMADDMLYMRAFGKTDIDDDQKKLADRILRAIYIGDGKGDAGLLISKVAKENPDRFIRDFAMVADMIKDISQRQGSIDMVNLDQLEELFKQMQKTIPAAVDPNKTADILRTGYMALAEGKTPQQALRTVNEFLMMAAPKGDLDHMIGLSVIYEKQLQIMEKEFEARMKRPWSKATPRQKYQWREVVEANPGIRDRARLQALNEQLTMVRRDELRAQGKDDKTITATLATKEEKERIAKQADEMNKCQGGCSGGKCAT